jgi:hypothetical protein
MKCFVLALMALALSLGLSACAFDAGRALGSAGAPLGARPPGRITTIEVLHRQSPIFGGRSFPGVGQYEKIEGRYQAELDPAHAANAAITDLAKAPRNSGGAVEYTAGFYIIKPIQAAQIQKPVVLYDFGNRGDKYAMRVYNETAITDDPIYDQGNGFLLRHGYTLVWSGVLGDASGLGMTIDLPSAKNDDGSTIENDIWDECHAGDRDDAWANVIAPYATCGLSSPVPRLDKTQAHLLVRERRADAPRTVSADGWEFIDDHTIRLLPGGTTFQAGFIYQFVHRATNPKIMGIGLAAVRDWVSFLRNEDRDAQGDESPLSDVRGRATVLSFGASQTGRVSFEFLYKGFNDDGANGRVFDGMTIHVASSRPFMNYRFAQPGRCGDLEHECLMYPSKAFPFAFEDQADSLGGDEVDGILHRCAATDTCPKVMHTFTSSEYWQFQNSNVTTDPLGKRDAEIPPSVREYFFAGTNHFPNAAQGACQRLGIKNNYMVFMRPLLLALESWARDGQAPPASRIPRIADGTLVTPNSVRWPLVGSDALPTDRIKRREIYDYGPDFARGIITQVPPTVTGREYPVLLPQVDVDGNELAGVKLPVVSVPSATYTGGNRRATGNALGELCGLRGSTIPFAATRAQRLATGDPRLSLEERYVSDDAFTQRVDEETARLLADGWLLPEDAENVKAEAAAARQRDGS